jgi:hypothetical protein
MLGVMPTILHFLSGADLQVQEAADQVRELTVEGNLDTIMLTDESGFVVYVNPSHVEFLRKKQEPSPPRVQ